MSTKSIPKWLLVLLGLALLWLGIAAFIHAADAKDGLEAYLSDQGCYGGAGKDAPSESDCSRSEWFYQNWWVFPTGAVASAGVLIVGFAWASIPGREMEWPDNPDN
jgi:hypothetical protein